MLKWINLYGGPNDFSNATQKWMNKNPDKGSEWKGRIMVCLLYTSPSPRDKRQSRMPSSA